MIICVRRDGVSWDKHGEGLGREAALHAKHKQMRGSAVGGHRRKSVPLSAAFPSCVHCHLQ